MLNVLAPNKLNHDFQWCPGDVLHLTFHPALADGVFLSGLRCFVFAGKQRQLVTKNFGGAET
jgi:hypothetical protein